MKKILIVLLVILSVTSCRRASGNEGQWQGASNSSSKPTISRAEPDPVDVTTIDLSDELTSDIDEAIEDVKELYDTQVKDITIGDIGEAASSLLDDLFGIKLSTDGENESSD